MLQLARPHTFMCSPLGWFDVIFHFVATTIVLLLSGHCHITCLFGVKAFEACTMNRVRFTCFHIISYNFIF